MARHRIQLPITRRQHPHAYAYSLPLNGPKSESAYFLYITTPLSPLPARPKAASIPNLDSRGMILIDIKRAIILCFVHPPHTLLFFTSLPHLFPPFFIVIVTST